jgi:hypothetical protein
MNRYFFLVNRVVWNHVPHCNVAFLGKYISTRVASTNVAGLGPTYDVTDEE